MARPARSRSPIHTLALLTKARLGLLVTLTTIVGFVVASVGDIHWGRLVLTAVGTTLAAFGANAFNQCIERARDARMERTKGRPLPAGTLTLGRALFVSALLALAGDVLLAVFVNALTAGLALLIQVIYLFVYTPLKPRTPVNTLVGAVCGAIPPMMGWTAVRGQIDPGAWILFLILFVWQMPHFLSLAWLYRDDYARGGFRMLPSLDPTGMLTCNLVVLYTAALLPLALATTIAGMAGWTFFAGALVLSIAWIVLAVHLRESRELRHARRVFYASLVYLPLLLALLVYDRGPAVSPGPSFQLGAGVQIPASASLAQELDIHRGMSAGSFGLRPEEAASGDAAGSTEAGAAPPAPATSDSGGTPAAPGTTSQPAAAPSTPPPNGR